MPSPESSRLNSRKSTGPSTPEGKAAVRFNALWHHGCAESLLIPGENADDFTRLQQAFLDQFRPKGPKEQFLVNRMVLAAWRLRRLTGAESLVINHHATHRSARADVFNYIDLIYNHGVPKPPPDPNAPPDPDDEPPTNPVVLALIRDFNSSCALVKLSRWQNALERSYYRAFDHLQDLQQRRAKTKS